jgi:hypothetical protein
MEWIVDESRKEQVQLEGMMGEDQILYHEGGRVSLSSVNVCFLKNAASVFLKKDHGKSSVDDNKNQLRWEDPEQKTMK